MFLQHYSQHCRYSIEMSKTHAFIDEKVCELVVAKAPLGRGHPETYKTRDPVCKQFGEKLMERE